MELKLVFGRGNGGLICRVPADELGERGRRRAWIVFPDKQGKQPVEGKAYECRVKKHPNREGIGFATIIKETEIQWKVRELRFDRNPTKKYKDDNIRRGVVFAVSDTIPMLEKETSVPISYSFDEEKGWAVARIEFGDRCEEEHLYRDDEMQAYNVPAEIVEKVHQSHRGEMAHEWTEREIDFFASPEKRDAKIKELLAVFSEFSIPEPKFHLWDTDVSHESNGSELGNYFIEHGRKVEERLFALQVGEYEEQRLAEEVGHYLTLAGGTQPYLLGMDGSGPVNPNKYVFSTPNGEWELQYENRGGMLSTVGWEIRKK